MAASARQQKSNKRTSTRGSDGLLPNAERMRQGEVIVVAERDPEGWPVLHGRAVDTLGRLLRNGLIEAVWASAGNRFRRDYHVAHFVPLSASDLSRARGAGGREEIKDRVEDARQRVWDALRQLGGMSSPSGSAIWHVVGGEMTLRDWAVRQGWGTGKPLRQEVATGILVAALAALSAHYARTRLPEEDGGRR